MNSAPVIKAETNNGKAAEKAVSPEPSQKWARASLKGRIFWGAVIIVGVAALIGVVVVSQQSGEELQKATQAVTRTREIIEKLGDTSTKISEVESSARSFAISGKQSHLPPFFAASKEVPTQMQELKGLLRGNPKELQAFTTVEPIVLKHLKVMKDMVDLGNKNLFRGSSQRSLTDEGNKLMEQIRSAFAAMEKRVRMNLQDQEKEVTAKAERVTVVSLEGSVLAGLLVLVCGASTLRTMLGRDKAQEKLDRLLGSMPDALVIVTAEGKIVGSNRHTEKLFGYNDRELEGESMALLVPERFRQPQRQYYAACFSQNNGHSTGSTVELRGLHKDGREFPIEVSTKPLAAEKGVVVISAIRDLTERKRAEEQISKLNKELELRALELETANKELEAFSYSVSHDLRSPLQNIDSFSQILMEDYANRLDAEGRDYVERLRGSCKHMEEIIDALLALSNMMRNELVVEQFDLTALAKAVAADLKQKNPDRLVEWVVADGLTAKGDPQLIRVVLENLLGNAWKFTSKRPRARIEFGALPQSNGARTYFVRDDGAGFDMTRAKSLFAPFKRLHDQSQFRGTGIGLATVQRVIQRHRGKIWAEGAVNQGATFCFTLDGENGANHGQSN